MPLLKPTLVAVALAAAMHLDWHAARPAAHHLSMGWSWHWLLGVPVFALVGWYVHRAWPTRVRSASLGIIGGAGLLAGVVEPLWELSTGAPFAWAFGRERLMAFALFTIVGILSYVASLRLLTARAARGARAAG